VEYITKNSRVLNVIIIASLLAAAVFIRAPGLGKWCLTEDEYYFSQPVAFILEKGVPQFPSGGYYTRGFGLQYLTVLPALVFKKWEFAVRIVPLLFGVLTVPMFFLLASRFLRTAPAILCSGMLLLSSWHIEFSRFARFYAPFQFLFLLFIYSIHEGYRDGTGRRGYRILAFALGLLSITIDSYSIFLPLVLFSLIFLLDEIDWKTTLSIFLQAGILVVINLIYSGLDFGGPGLVNSLPPGTILEKTSPFLGSHPIVFPNFELFQSIGISTIAVVGYLTLLVGAGYLLRKCFRHIGNSWDGIALVLSLSLPLLHQYTLLAFLVALLLINKRSTWGIFKQNAPLWGIYWIGTAMYWAAIAATTGNLDKILFILMGFPPIKHAIFLPFLNNVPLLGGFLLVTVIISAIHQMIRQQSWNRRFVISVVLLLILIMPVFHTFQRSTRYIFFFFPLVLLWRIRKPSL
jgi:hypothetical protein